MTQEIFVGFCFRNVWKMTKGVIIDKIISHQPAKPGWCFLIVWFPRNYFYPCQSENPHSQSGMWIAFIYIDNKLLRCKLYAFAHHLLPKRPCARIRVCHSHIKCGFFKCRAVKHLDVLNLFTCFYLTQRCNLLFEFVDIENTLSGLILKAWFIKLIYVTMK